MKMSLLQVRNMQKKRTPPVRRSDHLVRRLDDRWRKPRGHHNKMRLHRAGHCSLPRVGYGSPRPVSGLTSDGRVLFFVSSLSDLDHATPDYALMISRIVGSRRRVQLLEAIQKKGLALYKSDVAQELTDIQRVLSERVQLRKKKLETRHRVKQEALKKKEEKSAQEKKDSQEEISSSVPLSKETVTQESLSVQEAPQKKKRAPRQKKEEASQ